MKKILLIVSNETAAILMASLNNEIKNSTFDLIIEKSFKKENKVEKNILQILKSCKIKKFFILEKCSADNFFYFKKIFNLFKILKKNRITNKYLKSLFLKNNLKNYDEIWFSHEHCSRFIINEFKKGVKKRYFFHGYGDINLLIKHNFIKKIKVVLEKEINKIFFNNIIPINDKEIYYYNFFNKYYNKNVFYLPKIVKIKNYKKILNNLTKQLSLKDDYKNSVLISGNLPTFNNNELINKYIDKYTNLLKKNIPINKKYTILIKEKNDYIYNNYARDKFLKKLKNIFPNKIVILKKIYRTSIPFEVMALKINPSIIISQLSTSDFILSEILSKTKYLSVKKFNEKFRQINNINSSQFLSEKKIVSNSIFVQNNLKKPKNIKFI